MGGELTSSSVLEKIPLLNTVTSINDIEAMDGSLVRFSGLVQNSLDYDYYLGVLNTED